VHPTGVVVGIAVFGGREVAEADITMDMKMNTPKEYISKTKK
jgi:hypothetical protein